MCFYQSFVIGVPCSGHLKCHKKSTMSCNILSLGTVQPVAGCKERANTH